MQTATRILPATFVLAIILGSVTATGCGDGSTEPATLPDNPAPMVEPTLEEGVGLSMESEE